jgi:uncharacterized membrane protein YdjX (TVP38/TMEM64 family)
VDAQQELESDLLIDGQKFAWRRFLQTIRFVAGGKKRGFCRLSRRESGVTRWSLVLALAFAAAALAALWKFTPLGELLTPSRIAEQLERVETSDWAPLYFLAAFIVGGLVMFPVTVLSAATAITFAPYKAAPISFTGILLSAALLHWLGARFLQRPARKMLGRTIVKIDDALKDRSILTIATLRMMPLAPFTLVNLAAGAMNVKFSDYMLGTALGLAPGLTMMCIFGRQVRSFWNHPSVTKALVGVAIAIVWIGISMMLQRWMSRRSGDARPHHA